MKMLKILIYHDDPEESCLAFNLATEDQKEHNYINIIELSEEEVKEFTEIQIAYDKMQDKLKELYESVENNT